MRNEDILHEVQDGEQPAPLTFATWLDEQFTQMAGEYRFKLQQCLTIWADCCKGCIITPEAREDEYLRRCGVDPETGEYLI